MNLLENIGMGVRPWLVSCFWLVLGLSCATAVTAHSTMARQTIALTTPSPTPRLQKQVILVAFRPGSKSAASMNSNVAFRPGSKSADNTLTLQAAENVDFKTSAGGTIIDAISRTEHIVLKTPSTPALSIKDSPANALVLVKSTTKAQKPSYCWFKRGTAFAVNPVAGSNPVVYHVTDGVSVIATTLRPRPVATNGSMPCP